MKSFLSITDICVEDLNEILDLAIKLRQKRNQGELSQDILTGKTLAMIFEKPSLRTRVSFEQGMYELGGRAIILDQQQVGLGQREAVSDVIQVLSGMVHAVAARVFEHEKLIELDSYSDIPIINMLSDKYHPCQALADILTLIDEFGRDLKGKSIVFVGDGNNVARSLALIAAKLGINFTLAAPSEYSFKQSFIDNLNSPPEDKLRPSKQHQASLASAPSFKQTNEPFEAVKNADAIITDTFVSMGQEEEKNKRLKDFSNFQVNKKLLDCAPSHAIVMHCLPAYRQVEITDEVIDGPRSRVFPEAHNRLHAQKGLLAKLLGKL